MTSGESFGDPYTELSPRERELLRLLGRGMAVADIARQLGLSTETVVSSSELIRTKLGLAARDELRAYALRRLVSGGEAVSPAGCAHQLPLPFGDTGPD
jgi:DNA-binding NarL/FixJ family response regulator